MLKINFFINILFLAEIKSKLYISMDVLFADECINKIYIKNNSDNITYFILDQNYRKTCNSKENYYYPNNGTPIIENKEYIIGQRLFVEVYDRVCGSSLNIIVRINEYIIMLYHQKYWNCLNCPNFTHKTDFLDLAYEGGDSNNIIYSLYFQIDNFEDFKFFEIDDTFFSLTSLKIFNRSLYYKNDFLELINFNTSDNFYITKNNSLEVNYTNYKFLIEFNKNFSGTLIGLNANNSEMQLNSRDYFYINESNGLKYILSLEDKKNYGSILEFNIQAYNEFSNAVSQKQEFIFNIILEGDNLKCLNKEIYIDSESIRKYISL